MRRCVPARSISGRGRAQAEARGETAALVEEEAPLMGPGEVERAARQEG